MNIMENVSENVKLLSTEEIYERFKSQVQSEYTISKLLGEVDAANWSAVTVKVTGMQLYMMRIKEKGTDNLLLLLVLFTRLDTIAEIVTIHTDEHLQAAAIKR